MNYIVIPVIVFGVPLVAWWLLLRRGTGKARK